MVETRGISTPVKRLDPSAPNKEGEFVSASTLKRERRRRLEYEEKNERAEVDMTMIQGQGTRRRRTNNSTRKAVLEQEQQQQPPSEFEFFMGFPMLAGITMLILPCVVVTMAILSGYYEPMQHVDLFKVVDCVKDLKLVAAVSCFGSLGSIQALSIFLGWIAFQVILERVLPCDVVPGKLTPGGRSLSYRINGHLAFWVSLLVVVHFPGLNLNLSLLYVHFPELAFVACSICML
eukprot:236128_1